MKNVKNVQTFEDLQNMKQINEKRENVHKFEDVQNMKQLIEKRFQPNRTGPKPDLGRIKCSTGMPAAPYLFRTSTKNIKRCPGQKTAGGITKQTPEFQIQKNIRWGAEGRQQIQTPHFH